MPFSWKCFQISQAEAEAENSKSGEERQREPPGGGSGAVTTTGVTCALTFASFSETCTVVVSGGASAPTGTVTFASVSGGVFQFGNTCQLVPARPGVELPRCVHPALAGSRVDRLAGDHREHIRGTG